MTISCPHCGQSFDLFPAFPSEAVDAIIKQARSDAAAGIVAAVNGLPVRWVYRVYNFSGLCQYGDASGDEQGRVAVIVSWLTAYLRNGTGRVEREYLRTGIRDGAFGHQHDADLYACAEDDPEEQGELLEGERIIMMHDDIAQAIRVYEAAQAIERQMRWARLVAFVWRKKLKEVERARTRLQADQEFLTWLRETKNLSEGKENA